MVKHYQPTNIHERRRFLAEMDRKWQRKYELRRDWLDGLSQLSNIN